MKLRKLALVPIVAALMAFGAVGPVSADTTFSVSGNAGGSPVSATALFHFGATFQSLSVTLTNTENPVAAIAQSLTGIAFGLSGSPLSALSLTSLSDPYGTWNCVTSCTHSNTQVSLATSGWIFNSGTGLLAAGGASFHPYGIVNDTIQRLDGIKNGQHNPWLDGPVTFSFAINNPSDHTIGVTGSKFYFGTSGENITAIPEPETYAMLLAGLGLMGFIARRRTQNGAAA